MQDDATLLKKRPDFIMKLQFFAYHFYCHIILLFFNSNPRNSKHGFLILSLFDLMMILITLVQIEQKLNDITICFDQQILINLNLKLLAKYFNSIIISKQAFISIFITMVCYQMLLKISLSSQFNYQHLLISIHQVLQNQNLQMQIHPQKYFVLK